MDEADRIADRVGIIDHGELLVLDTPEALKRKVGEGDVVEIDLAGEAEEQQKALNVIEPLADHVFLDEENGRLAVRAPNAVGALPKILSTLEGAGLLTLDVRMRRNTLEDVFIQLTGRRLRE
jgi:ABC-2 type transport system ATP-binding protein